MTKKENPGEVALHQRVYRARGKAREHPCVDCEGPATEWSRIHGRDGKDVKDYEPRCKKDHHAYDRANWEAGIARRDTANISKAATRTNLARWKDPEHRAKMSAAVAASNRRRAGK